MLINGPRKARIRFREAKPSSDLRLSPLLILVDTREQTPWTFHSINADKKIGGGKLYIQRRIRTLKTGDYSLHGYQEMVTVERKSPGDLLGTLTNGRERFERQHERMRAMGPGNAIVIIEAPLMDFVRHKFGGMQPKTLHRTFVSWTARYGVPWFFVESRRLAEITCYRFLEKWWEQRQKVETLDADSEEKTEARKRQALIDAR